MKTTEIGPTGQLILDAIMRAEIPPTLRQLASMTGTSHANIQQHFERLKRLGLVTFDDKRARTVRSAVRFIPAEELTTVQHVATITRKD